MHSPRVAVLVETSTSWGQQVVKGIVTYVRSSRPWIFLVDWRGVHEQLHLPRDWSGDGIIARITTRSLNRQIEALGIPAVNVSWCTVPGTTLQQVVTDEQLIGELAVSHFWERGFRHFAYYGHPQQPNYVDGYGPIFVRLVAEHGYECKCFHPHVSAKVVRSRRPGLNELTRWLVRLPKPIAVLTWDAVRGRQVTEACWKAGIHVPEEVAVLAGYNDDLMCDISMPPLSSINDRPDQVGYAAAQLLDEMMRGRRPPNKPIYLPPSGVVVRQSTDVLAIEDPDISQVVRFIRGHACEGIQVDDILRAVPMSRSVLEYRFKRILGYSPHHEIQRVQFQRVLQLLQETKLSIAAIAERSGFRYTEYMTKAFKKRFKITPRQYRKTHHSRAQDSALQAIR